MISYHEDSLFKCYLYFSFCWAIYAAHFHLIMNANIMWRETFLKLLIAYPSSVLGTDGRLQCEV